jgi:hypothetical protein
MRSLRAEAQDLRALLARVQAGETSVSANGAYITQTMNDLKALADEVTDGDTIRHLHNLLEQMATNPIIADPATDLSAQAQLHAINLLLTQIRKIEYYVGVLTIPARVNDWLAQARPGYYFPFHVVFEDEVPVQEDRQKILDYLTWSPKALDGGLVDTANGLIYRYAKDPKARVRSYLLLAGGLILSVLLVIGAAYLDVTGWPIDRSHLPAMLIGWAAVLIGMVAHVGIGSVKRQGTRPGMPPITSVNDIPFVLDARAGQLLVKLLLAAIGFFGLVFTAGVDNVTPLNAFLTGYSLDSFVEVFGVGLEQQTTTRVRALQEQFGVEGG